MGSKQRACNTTPTGRHFPFLGQVASDVQDFNFRHNVFHSMPWNFLLELALLHVSISQEKEAFGFNGKAEQQRSLIGFQAHRVIQEGRKLRDSARPIC